MSKHRQIQCGRRCLATILALATLPFGSKAMAYEEPEYEILRETNGYEIRRYAGYIVAETDVSGDLDEAGSAAFRILAGYIFGNNRRIEAQPAASGSESTSIKMAMTVPVFSEEPEQKPGADYTYGFVMPSRFSLSTLPEPIDPRVRIRAVPERTVAVHRFSGRWTQAAYTEHVERLRDSLALDGIDIESGPLFARYNGPWTPWFLRRNEVMFVVASN